MQGIKIITTIIIVHILYITVRSNNTRQRNDLHLSQATLAKYQKEVYYSGIKTFNGLPKAIKDISSKPYKFKIALKHLYTHSLYTSDEFFNKQ
jgi:hypothetical protein